MIHDTYTCTYLTMLLSVLAQIIAGKMSYCIEIFCEYFYKWLLMILVCSIDATTSTDCFELVIFSHPSDDQPGGMDPDEAATRAKMKEAGYTEEEIQTMIDAGCTEIAD